VELTFPFRNWAYNSLLAFFEIGKIEAYSSSDLDIYKWTEEDFDVQFYHDRVPSFENELLQVINTTTQDTIDLYFKSLAKDIKYVKSLLTKEYLKQVIEEWNKEELNKFEELVDSKSEEYLKEPNRKRAHLEIYEQEIIPLAIFGMYERRNKIELPNYNYYCIEEKLKYIDPSIVDDYFNFLKEQTDLFIETAKKYGIPWQEGSIKSKAGDEIILKPILFCEGDIDITLINRAAELLERTGLLSKIELRYRGSCNNLDKLWSILTDNNWETVPQKKILLYDCDTNRKDENFGHIHRRTIPKIEGHIIQRGIENLFPEPTINSALEFKKEFVDFKNITGTERGIAYERAETIINKHEKRNFSDWLLEHGTKEDFVHFKMIFDILEILI
jgi:hypothetical protein